MASMRPVILQPRIKQTASMVFLHGLGDTGHGWAGILNTIRPDHIKVICPTAPVIPITLNMGFRMPAWFDIESLDRLEEETDIEGVKRAAEVVFDIIEGEIRNGIPSDRIIIGGFSQGAALALYCSLHCPQNLAACIILSGFFPETRLPDPNILTNKEIPYFQAHGESDNILPLRYGLDTSEKLKQFLKFHEFRTYNMQHETSDRELSDMKLFIEKVVGH